MKKRIVVKDYNTDKTTYEVWRTDEDVDEIITPMGVFKHSPHWDSYDSGAKYYFMRKDKWYRIRLLLLDGHWTGEIFSSLEEFYSPDSVVPGDVQFSTLSTFREIEMGF